MKRMLLAGLLLATVAVSHVQASPIPYPFHGTISVSNMPGISVGDAFSGTLQYDQNALYVGNGANFTNWDTQIGGITAAAGTVSVTPIYPAYYETVHVVWMSGFLFSDGSYDDFHAYNQFAPTGALVTNLFVSLNFVDPHRTTFTGAAGVLPGSLAVFDFVEFRLSGRLATGDQVGAAGLVTLDSQPPAVPEPASLLLVGTGLVGLGRAWRARRS